MPALVPHLQWIPVSGNFLRFSVVSQWLHDHFLVPPKLSFVAVGAAAIRPVPVAWSCCHCTTTFDFTKWVNLLLHLLTCLLELGVSWGCPALHNYGSRGWNLWTLWESRSWALDYMHTETEFSIHCPSHVDVFFNRSHEHMVDSFPAAQPWSRKWSLKWNL